MLRRAGCAVTAAMVMLPGCSSSHASAPEADAGVDSGEGGGIPKGAFGDSACARCVASSCRAALSDCASDPDCAAYWSCVERCGVGSNGDVDPACQAACPTGASSSGTQAELELEHCRSSGAGALCARCGTSASRTLSPILNQQCSGKVDADASACDRCITQRCCDTHVACGKQCSDYIDCLTTKKSYELCQTDYPTGFLPGEQDRACISLRCYTAGFCVSIENSLYQCIFQECASEYANLVATVEGALYVECLFATFDAPQCLTLYTHVGEAVADAMNTCIENECQTSVLSRRR